MPDRPETRQKVAAGRDAYVAGRDLTVNVTTASKAEAALPGLLPRDVPAFTGRDDELARLAELGGGGRVVVSAIGGTAGVGKTALAVHAAHQLLGEFPDGHLYADLRGYTEGQDPAEPGDVLQVLLRRLGVPAEEVPAEVEERSGLLRQLLAARRVLMVLDNARSETQVRPLLPGAGGSLVLVTSRSVLPGLEVDERISLDVLPEDKAAAVLVSVIGAARAAGEAQAVAEVVWLCGRLPLALRVAGQLLAAHPAWPVGKLASMLAGEQDRLARLGAGDLQVRTAFEVSYRQLAGEDARMFRLLGLHPGPDFTARSAAALAGTKPEAAARAVERLAEVHLVTEDATGRFGMHDLLRLFARQTCQQTDSSADREAAEARLVDYHVGLAEFLESCVEPRQRPAAEQVAERAGKTLPSMHEALAAFQLERTALLAALSLAAERRWDQQVQRLSNSTADPLGVLRYLDDLLTVQEAALAAARHAGDRNVEGRAIGNLGVVYSELRRFDEAIDCYEQVAAIFRETGDRPGESQALTLLGADYSEVGRSDEAIECYEHATAISREIDDRHGEGHALANLGITYRELRRFDEAIDCLEQATAILRATGDRRDEGQALGNLGWAYGDAGRVDEAIECYEQSLAIFRETGDRYGEGQALSHLGSSYGEAGRSDEAIDCHQQAVAILRETGDRRGEGLALANLGFTYRELRRFDEAIDCLEQATAILRETGDRRGEGRALTSLGLAFQQMRQPNRAAPYWREAAAIMRDTGAHEEAGRLEKLAANVQSRRRWWSLPRWGATL
jgi:tetratricopeptide (TPR) repeat protein